MLLILPVINEFSWKHFPYGVFALVSIISSVFILFQYDDSYYQKKAIEYYFDSQLNEIELPYYIKHVKQNISSDGYYQTYQLIKNNRLTELQLYWLQRTDINFQQALESRDIITEENPKYWEWIREKREYQLLLSKDMVNQFGFKSGDPTINNIFFSMFVHGSWMHFIGNIIFLILIGVSVEGLIGPWRLICSFIISGLVATSIYAIFTPMSLYPLVGSSGAIAGLMAIFAVVYGNKRLNFFVNLLLYMRVVSLPAMLVLPLWIGWEVANYYYNPFAQVAFISHIGGLSGGILLGIILRRTCHPKDQTDESRTEDEYKIEFELALKHISDLNFHKAKSILFKLYQEYPANTDVLFQLHNVCKMEPSSEDYHFIVAKIFAVKGSSKAIVTNINLVFRNYIKNAEPSIRFDPNVFLKLSQQFRKYGYLPDTEKILRVLIKHQVGERFAEMLAREQLLLARSYFNKNDKAKGYQLIEWLINVFPNSEAARQAKSMRRAS